MKIITLNPYNNEHKELIDKYSDKEKLNSFMTLKYKTEEEYISSQAISNNIYSCILSVEKDEIKNYCIYSGVKDTGLVQMKVKNLHQKRFLEESIKYGFNIIGAHTLTIFTEKENAELENNGFENLGSDNNIVTYIKEKEVEKELGRVR